jgi:hypothetical protein
MKQQQIGKKEIIMIIVTIALMIILGVKSTFFDEVRDLPPAEQQFKDFVDYSVQRDYDGMMEKAHLMVYRVYKIEMADKKQNAVLKYKDPETGKQVEIVQDGRYNAKVRGYVLWIFPVNQFEVTAEIQK